jgi:hypothetical protein
LRTIAVFLSLTLPASHCLACEQPRLPVIPAEADVAKQREQIVHDVHDYAYAATAYLKCIEAEIKGVTGRRSDPFRRDLLVRRNNAAVQEMNAVTQLFVERVGPVESIRVGEVLADATRCNPLAFKSTKVVDNQEILFFLLDGRIYLNVLDKACFGLHRTAAFAHDHRQRSFCAGEDIQVADDIQSTRCSLGQFYPISRAQADRLASRALPEQGASDDGSEDTD